MAARTPPTPPGDKNIPMMGTDSSTKPDFCRPRQRRTTSKSHVRQCFFCQTSLSSKEIRERWNNFPAELYGSAFRRICVIINSEHAIIEKAIENLPFDVVNTLVHTCDPCRGLMLHVSRLLENSRTKERTVIEEQVRIMKNMLTFKILQAENKVNLFPLPEGIVDPQNVHMHWETKLREIECVANLECTAVCLENQQLTPFGNVPELPPSLQQGYLTLNVMGHDYMEDDMDQSDDEVQFIEEKIKPKSVEILGIDDEAYAKLKAAATSSSQYVPPPTVFLNSNVTGIASTKPESKSQGNRECVPKGSRKTNPPVCPQVQVWNKPVTVSGLTGDPQRKLYGPAVEKNKREAPVSHVKGFQVKRQKIVSNSKAIGRAPATVAPSTSTMMGLQSVEEEPEANSVLQIIGSTVVLPQMNLQYADSSVDRPEPINFIGHGKTTEENNESDTLAAEIEPTDSGPQSPTGETTDSGSIPQLDSQLQTQNNAEPQPNKPDFACSICAKVFRSRNSLNGHVWMHRRPYCALCRTFLSGMVAYEGHNACYHDGSGPSICFVCEKDFPDDFKLKVHLRNHKEGNTYSCSAEGCRKTFPTKLECIKHLKLCLFTPPLEKVLNKRKKVPRNKFIQQRLPMTILDTPPPSDTQSDSGSASGSGSGMTLDIAMYTGFTLDEVTPEDEYLADPSESDYEDNNFTRYETEQEAEEVYEEEYEYGDEEQEFEFEEAEIINPMDPLSNV